MSGNAPADAPNLTAGTCAIVEGDAPGMLNGDHPILQVPAAINDGLTVDAMTADMDGKLRIRVCNRAAADFDSPQLSYGYLVLR